MRHAPQDRLSIDEAVEERIRRRDRIRYGLAFGGAVLLHASTALGLVYWEPPERVAPPGEMIITFDLEAAALSDVQADQAGVAAESAPQILQPPTPPEEEVKEEEVVEEAEPAPEPIVEEEVAEVPKAEVAEVVIAPKPKKRERERERERAKEKEKEKEKPKPKRKPKPKPAPSSQAAASASTKKSEVSGRGASASPSEINAYAGRVRAAIERRKSKPSSAGSASGTAHLSFTITRSGGISGLWLSRSSGNAALDGAARGAVASAGIPAIPESLPAPMSFGVPINFR